MNLSMRTIRHALPPGVSGRASSRPALGAAIAIASLLLAACAGAPAPQPGAVPATSLDTTPEIRPGVSAGYLADEAIPDSLHLVPAPPAPGSAALAHDHAVMRAALAMRDTPRFEQARIDADLDFPFAAGTFACALGTRIDAQHTPAAYRLLRRTLADASHSTRTAKDHYQRTRPFVENGAPTGPGAGGAQVRGDRSYPSGHAAIGWTWALVLAQLAPERTDALVARGRNFGESRLVCNMHWQSDILQSRFMGSATFARLQSDPGFRADMAAASKELALARAQGLQPDRDCAAEAAALSLPLDGVL